MKKFIDLSRCDRSGVYAEYCAWVIKTVKSAERGIYRNGFLFLLKISLKFNFLEILYLYYNIMSIFYSPFYNGEKEIMRKNSPLLNFYLKPIMWGGCFFVNEKKEEL